MIFSGPAAAAGFSRRALALAAVAAACVAAGCQGLPGDIDDGGRSYERTINQPVASNLEPNAADASIPLINQRLRPSEAQQRSAGSGRTSTCNLENWEQLIGRPRAEAESLALPENVRFVTPESVSTLEYDPTRLNIWLDREGVVYRVLCG